MAHLEGEKPVKPLEKRKLLKKNVDFSRTSTKSAGGGGGHAVGSAGKKYAKIMRENA